MKQERPSSTARLIARSILIAERDAMLSRLLVSGEAEIIRRILQGTRGDGLFRFALGDVTRKLLLRIESAMVPGIIAHYLARKRMIESIVREAISSGTHGVVGIAAGYDTLCLRLHQEFPEVQFLEIDHPATQAAKLSAFPETANLHYHSCDLTKEPLPPLSGDSSRICVIEGLTMYLDEQEVASLLRDISPMCHSVVFTFMEKSADGTIDFRNQSPLVTTWLKWRGEPFRWGISREALPAFLEAQGFHCRKIIDDEVLRREILAPLGLQLIALAQGECLCYATRISP